MSKPIISKRDKVILIISAVVVLAAGATLYLDLNRPATSNPVTLTFTTSHQVLAGNQTYPGFYSLGVQDLKQGQTFEAKASASGAPTGINFCILNDGAYQTWANGYYSSTNPGSTFPWNQCVTSSGQTLQTTLVFTVPSTGTWDIIAINNNPDVVTVNYSPAF